MIKRFYIFLFFIIFSLSAADSYAQSIKPIDSTGGDNDAIDISSDKLSMQEVKDDNGTRICYYETINNRKYLQINKSLFKTNNILMGIDDPKYCPLPGSNSLKGYEAYPRIQSQFLMSGIVCVVQSIILDSMFRVYCTILLWVVQILYAALAIYITFYGLAIMFDLTEEPLRQAPQKFMQIFFIIFFAVNAERAFYFIHKGFQNFLNGFSDMLTSVQPYYTDEGFLAYSTTEKYSNGIPKLLDMNGEVWKAPEPGSVYYIPAEISKDGLESTPDTIDQYDIPQMVQRVPIEKYVPYRVPAMQWTIDPRPDTTDNNIPYKLYPVFEEISDVASADFGGDRIACISDFRYDPEKKKLFYWPRCQPEYMPTVPSVAPFGTYYLKDRFSGRLTGDIVFAGPSGGGGQPGNQAGIRLYPPKFLDKPGNGRGGMKELCTTSTPPQECRQPFQSVLGKIDAMFNSIVGSDRVRSIGSMMMALILWGVGGGALLGVFLMLGITTMFVAFMQILWTFITSMMALNFMMMLSPLFVCFAMFKVTQKMFRGWLSNMISFALQPILVLAFLLVLSSATTLDRLTQLARYEVGDKRYEFTSNAGNTKSEMKAPGFLEPLYEVPPDYKNIFGGNTGGVNNANNQSGICNPADPNQNCGYITMKQREDYIKAKEEKLITAYALMRLNGDYYTKPDFQKLNDKNDPDVVQAMQDPDVVDIQRLMQSGQTFITPPLLDGVFLKGIKAVMRDGVHQDFLALYRDEIGLPDDDAYTGEGDPFTIDNNAQKYPQPNWLFCEDPVTLPPLAPAPSTCDSARYFGDANGNVGDGTNISQQEYPRCVKNCPAFDPPYGPPVGNTGVANFNPVSEQCTKFCLYIYDNKEDMFAYLLGSILVWIILNTIIGAFVSKIPALAQRLSPLDFRALSPPKLFGQSQQMYSTSSGSPRYGLSAYSEDEKYSSFYGMGTLFDTGLLTGKAGTIPSAIDKMRRSGSKKWAINNEGYAKQTDWKTYDEMLNQSWGAALTDKQATAAQVQKAMVYEYLVKQKGMDAKTADEMVRQMEYEQSFSNSNYVSDADFRAKAKTMAEERITKQKKKEEEKKRQEKEREKKSQEGGAGYGAVDTRSSSMEGGALAYHESGKSSSVQTASRQSVGDITSQKLNSEPLETREALTATEPLKTKVPTSVKSTSRQENRMELPASAYSADDNGTLASATKTKSREAGQNSRGDGPDNNDGELSLPTGGGDARTATALAVTAPMAGALQELANDTELQKMFERGASDEEIQKYLEEKEKAKNSPEPSEKKEELLATATPERLQQTVPGANKEKHKLSLRHKKDKENKKDQAQPEITPQVNKNSEDEEISRASIAENTRIAILEEEEILAASMVKEQEKKEIEEGGDKTTSTDLNAAESPLVTAVPEAPKEMDIDATLSGLSAPMVEVAVGGVSQEVIQDETLLTTAQQIQAEKEIVAESIPQATPVTAAAQQKPVAAQPVKPKQEKKKKEEKLEEPEKEIAVKKEEAAKPVEKATRQEVGVYVNQPANNTGDLPQGEPQEETASADKAESSKAEPEESGGEVISEKEFSGVKKKDLCPCGSGRLYGNCHGAMEGDDAISGEDEVLSAIEPEKLDSEPHQHQKKDRFFSKKKKDT